jgi:hypothetical protein
MDRCRLNISTNPGIIVSGQTLVPSHQLRLRLGRIEKEHTAVSAPIESRPPGIQIGPFQRDWTMESLMAVSPIAEAPAPLHRATAGVLHRSASPDESDARVGWTLYIECASTNPGAQGDSFTLWIGPHNHPLAAWTIDATGQSTFLRGFLRDLDIPDIQIAMLDDRWTAQIRLPVEAISDDMLLTLGVERTDADGFHSAWPRRMIPGQAEPGRLIIDVSTWDGFRQSP